MLFPVVHDYFKRKAEKERKKHFTFFWTGLPDGKPILLPTAYRWRDMGNIGGRNPNAAKGDAHAHAHAHSSSHDAPVGFRMDMDMLRRARKRCCCTRCFETIYIILCIIVIIKCVAEITVTITAAISTRLYSSELSGRLVAMILLALMAAITIATLAYAIIAVFRKQAKPLHAASLLLFFTAIIQGVTVAVGVRITEQDEHMLNRSLEESFRLAREKNPRNMQLWAATQSDFQCCGIYGPEDYNAHRLPTVFPPDVPISCCSAYDPSRSELVQEREREMCKATNTYYRHGCREHVLETFRTTSQLVLGMTSALMTLEVILSILSALLFKRMTRCKGRSAEQNNGL